VEVGVDLLFRSMPYSSKPVKGPSLPIPGFKRKSVFWHSKYKDLLCTGTNTYVLCRALTEESVREKLFEDYVELLQQKAKEKEKKREEEKVSSSHFSLLNFIIYHYGQFLFL
jgi:hypothetical protein